MFIIRQAHSAAKDFCQALNKVATRCLLLLSEILTVRAPREKTRYTKHERTPIYYHCMSFGRGVKHTECKATREDVMGEWSAGCVIMIRHRQQVHRMCVIVMYACRLEFTIRGAKTVKPAPIFSLSGEGGKLESWCLVYTVLILPNIS